MFFAKNASERIIAYCIYKSKQSKFTKIPKKARKADKTGEMYGVFCAFLLDKRLCKRTKEIDNEDLLFYFIHITILFIWR